MSTSTLMAPRTLNKKIKCQVVDDKCQKSSKSEILTCNLFMPIGIRFLGYVFLGRFPKLV